MARLYRLLPAVGILREPDELAGRHGGNRFANQVQGEVVELAETHARLARVEALACRTVRRFECVPRRRARCRCP